MNTFCINTQVESMDAFTTLKALRNMKKELEQRKQLQPDQPIGIKNNLQFQQKGKPMSMQELRQRFQSLLSKLNELDTKQAALQSISDLLTATKSAQSLQMVISLIVSLTVIKGNDGIVKTIQLIIEIYQTEISIQDLYKLLEIEINQQFFEDTSVSIQTSCCECWATAYNKNACKLQLEQKNLLLFQTLGSIISGGASRSEQETSMMALQRLYETINAHRDINFMKDTVKDFTQIYIVYFYLFHNSAPQKTQLDHASVYFAMEQLLSTVSIHRFHNQQVGITDKAVLALANLKLNYKTRISAANLLRLIGIQYQQSQFLTSIGSFHDQVIRVLDDQSKDRLIAIQNASRVALKEWIKVKLQLDALGEKKVLRTQQGYHEDFDIREKPYQKVAEYEPEDQNMSKFQPDGQNFIKKRSGIGGGNVRISDKKKLKTKPENESLLHIKQQILQQNRKPFEENEEEIKQEEQVDLDETVDFNQSNLQFGSNLIKQNRNKRFKEAQNEDIQIQPSLWQQVALLDSQGNQDEAINLLIKEGFIKNFLFMKGDDIYLLRQLLKQSDQNELFRCLQTDTCLKLVDRLILVMESDFLNRICLTFVEDFQTCGVGDMFSEDPQFIDFLKYTSTKQSLTGIQCKNLLSSFK